jgi:hypothetical protein
MRANKLFYDLYSTSGGTLPYKEYREWYDKHDTVYIILMDAGIYTKVPRQEMFNKNMHHGCFIEHYCFETPEQVAKNALRVVDNYDLMFVSPDEFIKIEKEDENTRTAKAFAYAERLIKEN